MFCYQNPVQLVVPNGKQNEAPFLSVNVRTGIFSLMNPMIAYSIGEVKQGSNNISSIGSRFATTRYDGYVNNNQSILSLNSVNSDEGSERGAFRHAAWQALITAAYGSDIAKQAGDAHEKNPNTDLKIRLYNNLADADQTVDLLNNIIGRDIGVNSKTTNSKDLVSSVLEEFYNNGLWQARKEDDKWKVFKGKLSDDKYNAYKVRLNNLSGLARDSNEQVSRDARNNNPSN